MTSDTRPSTLARLDEEDALQRWTRRLAVAMAEEGFAVTSNNRDEQWDAPYDEAYRIVLKLGLAAPLNADLLARVLRGLRYPPIRQVNGNQPGASWFEPDYDRHAETIVAEYSRLLEERPKVAPESESEKRYAAGDP